MIERIPPYELTPRTRALIDAFLVGAGVTGWDMSVTGAEHRRATLFNVFYGWPGDNPKIITVLRVQRHLSPGETWRRIVAIRDYLDGSGYRCKAG